MMNAWMRKRRIGSVGLYVLGVGAPASRMDWAAARLGAAVAATESVYSWPAVAVMVGVKVVRRATRVDVMLARGAGEAMSTDWKLCLLSDDCYLAVVDGCKMPPACAFCRSRSSLQVRPRCVDGWKEHQALSSVSEAVESSRVVFKGESPPSWIKRPSTSSIAPPLLL